MLHDGKGAKTLIFNYRTSFNDVWDDEDLIEEFGYEVVYGDGHSPVVVTLSAMFVVRRNCRFNRRLVEVDFQSSEFQL